ncbi:hypothetical protein M758_UG320100 [Ceratodon purpureus]|nr:hypothetical protein M758_UG320100 [Ceratodon purpureus]KAG0597200.1 hypothetical protein M758_UG320100 [Ceratodon purpureus]
MSGINCCLRFPDVGCKETAWSLLDRFDSVLWKMSTKEVDEQMINSRSWCRRDTTRWCRCCRRWQTGFPDCDRVIHDISKLKNYTAL